ncbi:RNase H family protein [Pseudoclavibacter sp. CFCC 13611]|uniref:RNase H family protein n=1 Tax=Pseudoclavibacter sp. CFCC 13611 TaxID=2615178 RepID=UPI0013015CEF|nr:RNase H family protein [Pseudoclavibacter sp. CFCC 13611]KAB1664182.1 hypothetical protein F8O08_01835 [Pseudoclavibacter sp. CFCC 13611]
MRPKKTSAAGQSITVYTDASFDPNEKRGVYGWVSPCSDNQQPDHWVGMRKAPSVNQLEVLAAIAAVMAHPDAHDVTLYTDSHAVIVAFEKASRSETVKGVPSARVEALHEVLQHVSVDVRKVAAHTTDYWNNVIDRVVRAVMRRLEVEADQVHLPKQDVVQAALDEARRTSNETARKAERDAAEQAAKSAAAEAQQHEDEKADRFVRSGLESQPGLAPVSAAADSATHLTAALSAELLAASAAERAVPDYLAPTSAGALSPLFGAGAEVAAELAAAGLGEGHGDGDADSTDAADETEETWSDPFAVPVQTRRSVDARSARQRPASAPIASDLASTPAAAPINSIFDLVAEASSAADSAEAAASHVDEADVALFDTADADGGSFGPGQFGTGQFDTGQFDAGQFDARSFDIGAAAAAPLDSADSQAARFASGEFETTDFGIFSSEASAEPTMTYSSAAPATREDDLLQHPASARSNDLGRPTDADVFSVPRSSDPFVLLDQLQLENQQLRHEHAVLREALEIMLRDRRA